ncbi:MAG: NAD(P)H-dependent glycerol-3-phosphate dehydrogenase [Oscillospiraceae bacterium]|nr:NAD(P)H-dependent glycerol-3-phosphate dehydrogenase [Oscillospiraceae bacterium]
MNVTVLGCGRWGSFIAWYLNKIGYKVLIWGKKGFPEIEELKKTRKNNLVSFDKNTIITDNFSIAMKHSEICIISISSQALRSFLMENAFNLDFKKKTIVLCMKGLEKETGKRLSQIVEEVLGSKVDVAIWVGPGHVQDITSGVRTCMVVDSKSEPTKLHIIKSFNSNLIRLYIGTDVLGNEIGAAAKNIMGIASGILDGIRLSSLKGVLMTRGAKEIADLISALGGKPECAYGLSHLGDYQATLFSEHSNNRKFGEMFSKGKKFEKLCEGIATTTAILSLAKKTNTSLPICQAVKNILDKKDTPKNIIKNLFERKIKREF